MANIPEEVMRRPLPSLRQWLDETVGTDRAEGYEQIAAFRDLAERTILQKDSGLPVEQACLLRLWQGFCVATVELCNGERVRGVSPELIVLTLPRALACAAMYAFASSAKTDTPFREVAAVLTEEFRAAAKVAANDLDASS